MCCLGPVRCCLEGWCVDQTVLAFCGVLVVWFIGWCCPLWLGYAVSCILFRCGCGGFFGGCRFVVLVRLSVFCTEVLGLCWRGGWWSYMFAGVVSCLC